MTIYVPREYIVDVCWVLKTQHGFDMLADLCGADRGPEEDPRFEVNYHVFSTKHYNRLRLKVLLSEDEANIGTVTTVWKPRIGTNAKFTIYWGVKFDGHPRFAPNTVAVRFRRSRVAKRLSVARL